MRSLIMYGATRTTWDDILSRNKRFIPNQTIYSSTDFNRNVKRRVEKKYIDKVFFTSSLLSASEFAKKASKKYGGSPVIYIVTPIGDYYNTISSEFIADKARVLGIYNK